MGLTTSGSPTISYELREFAVTPSNSSATVIAVAILVFLVPAAAEQLAPASAPNSPATYVTREQMAAELAAAMRRHRDPALAPIGVNGQYSIQEVHRDQAGTPAIHAGWTELHFILEGRAVFVTGGQLTALGRSAGSVIEGGVSRTVARGDAIIVPPDTPHWYKQITRPLTYLEVRFVSPGPPLGPR